MKYGPGPSPFKLLFSYAISAYSLSGKVETFDLFSIHKKNMGVSKKDAVEIPGCM